MKKSTTITNELNSYGEKLDNMFGRFAEIEVTYRNPVKASERPKVCTSYEVQQVFKNSWNPNTIDFVEEFKVMYLNRANAIIGVQTVSKGGVTGTVADPRVILSTALKVNACGIILAHNHPSGNTKPSNNDLALTLKIKEGARLFDITLLDHIILTSEGYFSFADDGLIQ